MKKVFLSIILLAGAMMGFAQEDKVLMTINGEPIMASEFLYIYEKNNQESSIEKKSMREYLDLFVNFKLKVTEAKAQGVDTTEAFKKELAGYRAQATPKYMQDNVAIDSLVRLSYNRMANIRRAAHIAIQCPAGSDSLVEAEALAKINLARERVTTGVEKKVKKGRKWIIIKAAMIKSRRLDMRCDVFVMQYILPQRMHKRNIPDYLWYFPVALRQMRCYVR